VNITFRYFLANAILDVGWNKKIAKKKEKKGEKSEKQNIRERLGVAPSGTLLYHHFSAQAAVQTRTVAATSFTLVLIFLIFPFRLPAE